MSIDEGTIPKEEEPGVKKKSKGSSWWKIALVIVVAAIVIIPVFYYFVLATPVVVTKISPETIPKFVNQLTGPPPVYVAKDSDGHNYTVDVSEFMQQILPPPMPMTKVWGYGGLTKDAVSGELLGYVKNSPGPTFEVTRWKWINVKWVNNLTGSHMFAVDPTLHWANPNNMPHMMNDMEMPAFPPGFSEAQSPIPIVTHLHGGEVHSNNDGGPTAWWTSDGKHGSTYATTVSTDANAAVYHYPNQQPAATLWYHDHALGITRLNVMSGLAGFYLIRDSNDSMASLLPSGKYEVPLVIQDRMFMSDGSFYFPSEGNNPSEHPYWGPEFFGDVIMVNGLVWPNMNVDQGQYRFRILDGSSARFYNLSFSNGMSFVQIGSDGGYLKSPASMTSLLIAPGERCDILVDFSGIPAGTKIVLKNDARAPFPDGDPALPNSTSVIMQFTVGSTAGSKAKTLPTILNPSLNETWPTLPTPNVTRVFTLTEVMGENGPLEILLDGQKWSAPVSEQPVLGTTEEWVIVNPTADTHPIHLHLVQFQLVSRQKFDIDSYYENWTDVNGMPPLTSPTININWMDYLEGSPESPHPNELGWKDTVKMNPGEVTIIRVRFAPIDGSASYPFDATSGPGYVWHCHILDHEDNEMMRPFEVKPTT